LRGLVFTEGDGVDDDAFTVVGSASALNEALRDLRYKGKPGREGWDQVRVSLSDAPLDVCAQASQLPSRTKDGAVSVPGVSSLKRAGEASRSGGATTNLNAEDDDDDDDAATAASGALAGEGEGGFAFARGTGPPQQSKASPFSFEADAHNVSSSMRWFAEAWLAESAMPLEGGRQGRSAAAGMMGGLRGPDTQGGGAPVGWVEQVPSRSGEVMEGSYPHQGQGAGKSGGESGSDSGGEEVLSRLLEEERQSLGPGLGASRTNGGDLLSSSASDGSDSGRLANFSFCDYGASHTVEGKIEVYLTAVNDPPAVTISLPPTTTAGATSSRSDDGRGSLPYGGSFYHHGNLLEAGMEVRIRRVSVEAAVALQAGHGGWVDAMADMLGSEGVVQRVDRNQDVKVHGRVWNQALLDRPTVKKKATTTAEEEEGRAAGEVAPKQTWVVTVGAEATALPNGAVLVSDPDAEQTVYTDALGVASDAPFTVTLRARFGLLTLATLDNVALLEGCDGVDDASITFAAGLVDVNRALNGLAYRCDPFRTIGTTTSSATDGVGARKAAVCGVGLDEVTIHVDDNGYSGRGGALTASAGFSIRVVADESAEDDGDATISFDEFNNGYRDSEDGDEQGGQQQREVGFDDWEARDDDGSGLADAEYTQNRWGGSGEQAETLGGEEQGNAAESRAADYPSGSLSWHDVNDNFEALDEERRTHGIGDGDFWDN